MQSILNMANIMALIGSFIAVFTLSAVALKVGGILGNVLKLLLVGIFFSVFIHAGAELLETYHLLSKEVLMPIMGILLTIGSVFFIIAGLVGLKLFNKKGA